MFTTKKKPENELITSLPSPGAMGVLTGARKSPEEPRQVQGSGSARPAEESRPSGRQALEEISPPALRLSKAAKPQAGAAAASTLNTHLSFDGDLKYTGSVTIDCEFRGSIVTDDTLVVGPSGKLNAEITAGVIEVSGKVHGNMKAKTRVKILTGGEVYGNIETPTISMDEGVVFEGNCTRPQASHPAPKGSRAAVEEVIEGVEPLPAASGR
jgi:cytoskeletal protein CcmA (bactofilin family)